MKESDDEPSSKKSDVSEAKKRGPYKTYLYHDSDTKVPGSTKRGWKAKRMLLRYVIMCSV